MKIYLILLFHKSYRGNITGNSFTRPLDANLFAQWTQAVAIDLSNNDLPGELPTSLESMANCTSFLAKNNQLSGGVPIGVKNMVKLEEFDISGNDIVGEVTPGMCQVFEAVPTVATVDCDQVTCACCDPGC